MTSEKTTPHVLLVEDDPGDAGLIRVALRENRFEQFDVTWVRTMAEAGSVFASTTIQALLLDLNLPDSAGLDTVLTGLGMAGDAPVVVLTGNDDLDLARRVMDMGAQDYLFKGACDADSLGRALRYALSRKRTEVDLIRQKAHFQSLFTNTNDAIIFFDVAERIVNVNERFSQLFGYSLDEARGREINSLVDPERQAGEYASPRILRGEAVEMEAVRFTRMGHPIHVLIKGGPVRVDGRIVGGYAIYSDITQRHQAENQIRNQEARLRAITDSARDAIVMIDPRGNISFWNPGAEAAFGHSGPEVMGRNMLLLLAPARYHEAYERSFTEFQATGQGNALGQTLELTALHKDGREIDVELSLSAFHQEDGWHAVGIMRDIRDRKQAEKKLQDYARQMEENNLELDAALLRARQATQAKSEFLANMSHEIRTPMNGVIGMVGLLLDTGLNETQRRYAQTAQSSGEALLALINDILDFSKIESGKLDMDNVDFQLRALLDDFATMMAFKAEEKGLEFICFADPDVPDGLRGDPGRLRQILTNLAGNAVKFTEQGEVVVRVALVQGSTVEDAEVHGSRFNGSTVEETEDGGNGVGAKNFSPDGVALNLTDTRANPAPTVNREPLNPEPFDREPFDPEPRMVKLCFFIRDTGIGIPADKVGSLFQSFTQVDASVTRRFGGTGLGLAISRQLAGLMGGEVGVDSREGRGSTFWFTVRLSLSDQPMDEPAPVVDLHGIRTLVVDDNATNREIILTRLMSWGMRPDEAEDGPSALRLAYAALGEGDPYRLGILDMQMPGMDGETLGRVLLQDQRLRPIRLMIMSSVGLRGDARRFEEAGFAAYLNKPVRHGELRFCLELVMAEQPPRKLVTRHRAREISQSARPDFSGTRARVLLVEDNSTNQQVALAILKNLGLSAQAVANGAEAVQAVAMMPFDLVLMDVQMPVMDGIEATRLIREAEVHASRFEEVHGSRFNGSTVEEMEDGGNDVGAKNLSPDGVAPNATSSHAPTDPTVNREPRIPIIAMTAHAMQGDRERFLEAGMDDYISKPVDPGKMAGILTRWLPKIDDIYKPGADAAGMPESAEAMTPPSQEQGTPGSGPGERAASSTPSGEPVLDRDELLHRLSGDKTFAWELLRGVLRDYPVKLAGMRKQLDAGNLQGLHELAHALKGASATVAARALSRACDRLERACRTGGGEVVAPLLAEVERQAEALRIEVEGGEGCDDR